MAEEKKKTVKVPVTSTSRKKKVTTKVKPLKVTAHLTGIDISEWQGDPNFDALRQAVDFVVFRSSFGTARADNSFAYNRDNARRVGLLRGFYHYAYPEYNSPEAEAEFFVATVGAMQHGEILMLDFEESKFTGDYDDWAVRFLIRVEQLTGTKPLFYTYSAMLKAHSWPRTIANGNGLWIASYTFNPDSAIDTSPWAFAAFFQYTDKTSVAGMAVDGDVFYGDSTAFQAYGYAGGGSNPTPAPSYIAVAGTATVTQSPVAWVRSAPNHTAPTAGSGSLATGLTFDYVGYVIGDDPYGDGRNIWLVSSLGHYVWEYATDQTVGQSVPVPPAPVITTSTVVVKQDVPFTKVTQDDPTLDVGQTQVDPGSDGSEDLTYTVTLSDGVEISRVLVSTVSTADMSPEVTRVGTKVEPEPTPDPTPTPVPTPVDDPKFDSLITKFIKWIVNIVKGIFNR